MPAESQCTVLHYTGYTHARGGIVSLIRTLHSEGKFYVLHGVSEDYEGEDGAGLELWRGPRIRGDEIGLANAWRAQAVARTVRSWLRADPQRIFHGHSRAGLLVGLWLRLLGERRVVVSVHCYGRQRWFYRWASRRLGSHLFWLSPAMKRYYEVSDTTWAQCIPGGVPPATVSRGIAEPGRLRLGGIGARVAWKGWSTVLEALALLPSSARTRVTFTHIGNGDVTTRAVLARQVDAKGLGAQVSFNGEEPSSASLISRIDALVVASVNEPFSIAMLEALAAGVPVIAADSGGARDVIREDINGRLYPTGDADALARLIEEWLANPPDWSVEQIQNTTVPLHRIAAQWTEVYAAL